MSLFAGRGQHNAAGNINIHPPDKRNQADLRILLGNTVNRCMIGTLIGIWLLFDAARAMC